MSFLTSSCMICVGFGLTSALLCIKIFFFPFSRTDSQTPNLSQYVLLISLILYNLNYNVPEKEVLVDPEKVLIDPKKALIDLENISIRNAIDKLNANQATKEKANLLFEKMGFDKIFGRKEIMENINL